MRGCVFLAGDQARAWSSTNQTQMERGFGGQVVAGSAQAEQGSVAEIKFGIPMTTSVDAVEIFTDGACKGNPGVGGWGALLRTMGKERELCGGEAHTT